MTSVRLTALNQNDLICLIAVPIILQNDHTQMVLVVANLLM